jgi:flavin reductase (DIM6/NTAB) family NADH-FMN oxidoreductase RutF
MKLALDPAGMEDVRVYKLLTGVVVPRPIGFISTVSPSGVPNAAPFSFFNGLSHRPPIVCFSSAVRDGADKDTLGNIRASGEFVVNIVSEAIAPAMNQCADNYPPEVSEFEVSGLTPIPAHVVRAPLVAESPVNMECRLLSLTPLPESPYTLVLGRVVLFHVAEDLLDANGRVDAARLQAVGRMAGNTYAFTREIFTMEYDSFVQVRRAR